MARKPQERFPPMLNEAERGLYWNCMVSVHSEQVESSLQPDYLFCAACASSRERRVPHSREHRALATRAPPMTGRLRISCSRAQPEADSIECAMRQPVPQKRKQMILPTR